MKCSKLINLAHLMRKVIECIHILGIQNTKILCGCYAGEGYPIINISQANSFSDNKKRICLYFQFCETFVQEAAYALWLEDQRKNIQVKAALHLEQISHKCRSCGGDGFIPGSGIGVSVTDQIKKSTGRKFSGKKIFSWKKYLRH